MIHTLLLTFVMAAGQSQLICKQIFDPQFCKGPAADGPGLTCVWQPNEFECKAMNLNDPKQACKALGRDQAACSTRPECRFDMFDGECKGLDMDRPGMMAQGQMPARNGVVPPQYPGASATMGGAPSTPASPARGTGVVTPTGTQAGSQQTGTPRFCKSLPELQCFGPSSEPGKLCYWDAEDFECSEATRGSIEAVCKQFGRDPTACDANENCFWDAKDYECSEIEFGMHFQRPVLRQQCSTFRTMPDCTSHADCFFDTTSNLCMNVVQAKNVCGVYNSPVLCSTNRLCHFRNGVCALAQTGAMMNSGLHLQSVHEDTKAAARSTTSDYALMFACGFSGSILGLLFAFGVQKYCQRKASQEDYRDIVLDVNSHRQV